jgi:hypothetical protein
MFDRILVNWKKQYAGQILVMFAAALVAILGFSALAVDVGFLLAERRGVQNAADAAAMAAARQVARGNDDATAEAIGYQYAELNGYADGGDTSVSIEVDGTEIRATVDHNVASFFLRAFYTGDWTVSASAAAEIIPDPGPFAMIALGEDANCHPSSGIRFSGTNDINVENGSIASNACIRVDGNSLDALIDGDIKALHGINDSHDRLQTTPGFHKDRLSNKVTDPFAHLVAPTCSDDGIVEDDPHDDGYVLHPGRYTNSNYPVPNNPGQISFLPGVYCIETLVRIGSQTTARSVDAGYLDDGEVGDGGGVLLYVTGGSGEVRFTGQGSIQIQSLGFYDPTFDDCTNACDENVVVWISDSNCSEWDSTGGTETTLEGVIYAPCSNIELGGNAGSAVLTGMIVADTIRLHGNVTLNLVADQDNILEMPLVILVE